MVAVSGEGKSETGVEEGGDLVIIPYPLLDFVPFAHNSCSKTSTGIKFRALEVINFSIRTPLMQEHFSAP